MRKIMLKILGVFFVSYLLAIVYCTFFYFPQNTPKMQILKMGSYNNVRRNAMNFYEATPGLNRMMHLQFNVHPDDSQTKICPEGSAWSIVSFDKYLNDELVFSYPILCSTLDTKIGCHEYSNMEYAIDPDITTRCRTKTN